MSTGEAPPRLSLTELSTFHEGDFVKINSQLEQVKELQEGHGEWVDNMRQVGVASVKKGVMWLAWVGCIIIMYRSLIPLIELLIPPL